MFYLNVVRINFLQIAAHTVGISCISAGIKIESYESRGITWGALCSSLTPRRTPDVCFIIKRARVHVRV
jgi:hypothetical protein